MEVEITDVLLARHVRDQGKYCPVCGGTPIWVYTNKVGAGWDVAFLCRRCSRDWVNRYAGERAVTYNKRHDTLNIKHNKLVGMVDGKGEVHIPQVSTVLFRRWHTTTTQGIIAILPDDRWNSINHARNEVSWMCQSYEHVGQHGPCDPKFVMACTKEATPEEYASLKKEMEGMGYLFKIVKKLPRF